MILNLNLDQLLSTPVCLHLTSLTLPPPGADRRYKRILNPTLVANPSPGQCAHIRRVQALVLSPTRELAAQTEKNILALGEFLKVQAHCCIGGKSLGALTWERIPCCIMGGWGREDYAHQGTIIHASRASW